MEAAKGIGSGELVETSAGTIFKLSHHPSNPIVRPEELGLIWEEDGKRMVGAVFNGGAEIFRGRVVLAPRCHSRYRKSEFFDEKLGMRRVCMEDYVSEVWILWSEDGLRFRPSGVIIKGDGSQHQDFRYGVEDIRIVRADSTYLLVGCGKIGPPFKAKNADRVAIYSTEDFEEIHYHGIIDVFDSRNAVPFRVDGDWYLLLRFHPNIHVVRLPEGLDMLLRPKQYRDFWKEVYRERPKSLLLKAGELPHEREKVGAGTQVLRHREYLVLVYHAVGLIRKEICSEYGLREEIRRGYSVCVALLDPADPRRVLAKTPHPVYIPSKPYELYGSDQFPVDVPAVVFPVGGIVANGKLLLYCGAGDKYEILIGADVEELVSYVETYGIRLT